MERMATIINAIHDLCLLLIGAAFLLGGWLVVQQLLAFV